MATHADISLGVIANDLRRASHRASQVDLGPIDVRADSVGWTRQIRDYFTLRARRGSAHCASVGKRGEEKDCLAFRRAPFKGL